MDIRITCKGTPHCQHCEEPLTIFDEVVWWEGNVGCGCEPGLYHRECYEVLEAEEGSTHEG